MDEIYGTFTRVKVDSGGTAKIKAPPPRRLRPPNLATVRTMTCPTYAAVVCPNIHIQGQNLPDFCEIDQNTTFSDPHSSHHVSALVTVVTRVRLTKTYLLQKIAPANSSPLRRNKFFSDFWTWIFALFGAIMESLFFMLIKDQSRLAGKTLHKHEHYHDASFGGNRPEIPAGGDELFDF